MSAARVAAQADSTQSAERRRIIIDIAGGAIVGAATWVVLGHAFYSVFRDTCETINELGARCGRPNYAKLALLGAASGAIAGAMIAIKRGDKGAHVRFRLAPAAQAGGVVVQLVLR